MFSMDQLKILDAALTDLYEKINAEISEDLPERSIEAKFQITQAHTKRLGDIIALKNYIHNGPFEMSAR